MSFKFKFIAAVAASAFVSLAAGTSNAGVILTNPAAIAGSGWSVSFSVPGIMLVDDGTTTNANGAQTVNLEKFAAFQSTEGLDITFAQTSANAAPIIDI